MDTGKYMERHAQKVSTRLVEFLKGANCNPEPCVTQHGRECVGVLWPASDASGFLSFIVSFLAGKGKGTHEMLAEALENVKFESTQGGTWVLFTGVGWPG